MSGETLPHNRSSYVNHGCRCDECRTAQRAYQRRYLQRRKGDSPPERIHGTVNGYNNWACRCELCKAADVAYRKALRLAHSRSVASTEVKP